MFRFMALLAMLFASAAQGAAPYAEGQVWEYRTRPSDRGSLLQIRRIEMLAQAAGQEPVYHLSVIGVHLGAEAVASPVGHLPVSRATLDASVVRLSDVRPEFPPFEEGVAEWRQAQGGVFTVPVAEIIEMLDQMIRQNPPQP